MLSFGEWRMCENVEIFSAGESFDFPEEEAGIDHETMYRQAWDLAKTAPINVLSDKELQAAAIQNGQVVGALFDSWHQDQYSFDVIVSPKFYQQGVGKKLIDFAMSVFRMDSDGRENAHVKAEVVNKNLIPLLTRLGFKPAGQWGGVQIMTYGDVPKEEA